MTAQEAREKSGISAALKSEQYLLVQGWISKAAGEGKQELKLARPFRLEDSTKKSFKMWISLELHIPMIIL